MLQYKTNKNKKTLAHCPIVNVNISLKGGNYMYTVKWIIDNLGISRKTLRYYEKKGLLKDSRNIINNYREYNEDRKSVV